MRRIDGNMDPPVSNAEIRQHLYEDLEGYVDFWAAFPDIWFGGLHGNKIAEPKGRNGGWGFVNGLSFDFNSPDDALLVTIDPGAAAYSGFQIIDPWMIAPDAKKHQVCLSSAQAVRNADGTRTYVLSKTDPGAANWLVSRLDYAKRRPPSVLGDTRIGRPRLSIWTADVPLITHIRAV